MKCDCEHTDCESAQFCHKPGACTRPAAMQENVYNFKLCNDCAKHFKVKWLTRLVTSPRKASMFETIGSIEYYLKLAREALHDENLEEFIYRMKMICNCANEGIKLAAHEINT